MSRIASERRRPKFFDIHFLAQRHRAEQMVRRFCQSRLLGLRREQIEPAINLERVRADDLRV